MKGIEWKRAYRNVSRGYYLPIRNVDSVNFTLVPVDQNDQNCKQNASEIYVLNF